MSDSIGVNWYRLIYPAVAIPILILAFVRWRIMRKRKLEQLTAANTNDNGFSAMDFVAVNPTTTTQDATVYNIEQPTVVRHQKPKDLFEDSSKDMKEEPPAMIQSKRWF